MSPLASLILSALLAAASASPQASQAPKEPQAASPALAVCPPLPALSPGPFPFPASEKLTFDLDVTGASAATMTMELLPRKGQGAAAIQPVALQAQTNTFFDKVRKVQARLVSDLDARTLFPKRLHEDIAVDDRAYRHAATFDAAQKRITVTWTSAQGSGGERVWPTDATDGRALDYLGAFYFFRALPLKVGERFCVDILGLRRLWRVEGSVVGREHASTPAGEFPVLRLSGKATRHDKPTDVRELHLWLSDDARRLPVAVMGVIDLGTLRAVLSSVRRPDFQSDPARPTGMTW
ncbi:MAG: DUF3108 domain-containing protein [Myxococcales bacterium]|jgi:hypothetical protein|nr:DUF3108 domain-containing protein [Myxococcales bacterium]